MNYRIELLDSWGRRRAVFDEVPLLEVTLNGPDQPDRIRGMLPDSIRNAGPGYVLKIYMDDAVIAEAEVCELLPEWGERRKLILDKYVTFHKVVEVGAERRKDTVAGAVSCIWANQPVSTIVRDAVNSALGPIHYTVEHAGYPDGAMREFDKFSARKWSGNELEVNGISTGQWAGPARIDASAAYAKDGDTIAGLVVDGAPWPDLRLTMIDCEELERNSHAIARHPEVADWTDEEYLLSKYRLDAEGARDALQDLIDTHGIDYIELNPHRDAGGNYDNRVDAYGRYIGLVYGNGLCFNAALVELGNAEVFLYEDGRYLVPGMALKEFYSYQTVCEDSIADATTVLANFDFSGSLAELLTAMAYVGQGYVWSVDGANAVCFRPATTIDRIYYYDKHRLSVALGSANGGLVNVLHLSGNPVAGSVNATFSRAESVKHYGESEDSLEFFAVTAP